MLLDCAISWLGLIEYALQAWNPYISKDNEVHRGITIWSHPLNDVYHERSRILNVATLQVSLRVVTRKCTRCEMVNGFHNLAF